MAVFSVVRKKLARRAVRRAPDHTRAGLDAQL